MKLNRKLVLILALVLSLALATGSTLAYLTDRDSEANVFTMGNVEIDLTEDFEQGAQLIPGVNVEKKPVITNTGTTDAWVWMTFSIPSALDNFVSGTEQGSNENTIHWNPLGATTEGYVTDARVNKAIADGHLPEGITAQEIIDNNMTWNVFNSLGEGENVYQEEINGVEYNTYVMLYNKALAPDETTLPSVYNVFLDQHVDIDPDGNMYRVEAGVAKDLNWNINENGNPIIYVSAYAMQTEGFETVEEAYAAYNTQWGDNGTEYGKPSTAVATADELVAALTAGESVILTADIELTEPVTIAKGSDVVLNLGDYEITADVGTLTTGYGMFNISAGASLTVNGDEGGIVMKTNVTKGISAAIFQNDGDLTINGGSFEANQANSVSGLGAVIAVIDNCVQSTEANVVINGGTFQVTGEGAINIIRSWPIGKGAVTTLTINGGTFKKNPDKTTYIWTKNDTNNDTAFAYLTVNGGTFEDIQLEVDGYRSKVSVDDSITGATVIPGGICGFLD